MAGEHSDMQTDIILAMSSSEDNRKWAQTLGHNLSIGNLKASPYSDILPQQGHTYSNKVIRPNSALFYELMGTITFKFPQPEKEVG